jgi:hypothetical protein
MIKFTGFSLFAGAAIAAAASLGGCSSSSSSPALATSAEGESCTRTSDCASDLVCIANTCLPKGTTVADGGVIVTPDGSVVVPPTGGNDGGATMTNVPEAAAPRLSSQGQECQTTADCAVGLACIPSGPYGGGVCDIASYGLTPTGKTCSGECNTAADCCELPTNVGTIGAVPIHTCQDILTGVLGGSTTGCANASAASNVGIGCFYYQTYCGTCATSNLWTCTSNKCSYTHTCANSGNVLNGCPSETRTGQPLTTNCEGASGTCKAAVVAGVCTADADCDGKTASDNAAITCRGGSCTCYAASGGVQGCYLKCANDLECRQGYHCDAAASKLCVQDGACSTDADCAAVQGMVNAKCNAGVCKSTCKTDHDCSSSGLSTNPYFGNSFTGQVCGSDGFCDPLGCANDADCENSGSNSNVPSTTLHLFCVAPPATAVTAVPISAVTN